MSPNGPSRYLVRCSGMSGLSGKRRQREQRGNDVNDPRRNMVLARGCSYTGLILTARITLPNFSISWAISFPKSAGEPAIAIPPSAFRDFLRQHGGPTAEGQELIAAKLMGRWRSGAPLILVPEKDDPALGADYQRNNNFNYAQMDPKGYAVPLGSHI